jgi:hypothetical protein
MPFCGMLRRVALVRTEASKERSASIIRVTRIGELGTTLVVSCNTELLPHKEDIAASLQTTIC